MPPFPSIFVLSLGLSLVPAAGVFAATDPWDLPPLEYSETAACDPIAEWQKELERDPKLLADATPLERLRAVLKHLEIPEESQVLVFSKTSKQNDLIHPDNPRSVFFNERAYVGYVPGGHIEVISQDPVLGPVFYLIRNDPGKSPPVVSRQGGDCFSCHGTARTEGVPGMLVRSVYADKNGLPILNLGSHQITHKSPIGERWGGYYVTGTSSLPHLGNRTFEENHDLNSTDRGPVHQRLDGVIDTSRYLRPTSDIVALMVLEHQCHVHNLLTAAGMNHRRYQWLRRTLHPEADGTDPESQQHMHHAALQIIDALLFSGEAELGEDGISGDLAYQQAYAKRFPRARNGRSLADFQLQSRLFKYPCSTMVYSPAFANLPTELRQIVLSDLKQSLEADPSPANYPHIPASTRVKIVEILEETVAEWPKS